MKKLISLLLALISVFTICLVPAYADDTNEIDETLLCSTNEYANEIIIIFDEKYVKFCEDITITLEYDDGKKVEWKNIACFSELYKYWDEESNRLVIVIKETSFDKINSITLPENIVFDVQGNGNKAKTIICDGYFCFCHLYHTCDISAYAYIKGDEITYTTILPGDFYVNGNLVAKNTYEYTLKIDAIKKYQVVLNVHGTDILLDSFNSAAYKERAKEWAAESIEGNVLATLLSPITVLLSPLFIVVPDVGLAALLSPITSVIRVFIYIFEYFRISFMR